MSPDAPPPGTSQGDPADPVAENARLAAKVAFLENKLQLVGSITRHDVLNQLTAIVGYNELLSMIIQDPKQKSFLEKERFAIDKIRRQFQFAKDYQNIAVEPPRWQNIRNLVLRVCEDFDLKGVRVTAETGAAAILADPHLDTVFHHIMENALVHGKTTSEIRISVQGDEHDGGLLVFENDGEGIPAEEKPKIFERGYGNGIGWGLFLSRDLLAATGMTIRETGDPLKGVRFEIILPAGSFRPLGNDTVQK
ncbi:MAG: HAMP domain-containing histidine kinase [Methanomicrobiales archaeon]|nr:HAMP domain-containing histidine kinase [Methanomicrobiales archaeon]